MRLLVYLALAALCWLNIRVLTPVKPASSRERAAGTRSVPLHLESYHPPARR
jgi:hypothetical protein